MTDAAVAAVDVVAVAIDAVVWAAAAVVAAADVAAVAAAAVAAHMRVVLLDGLLPNNGEDIGSAVHSWG